MTQPPRRIVLTGSESVGKTTLASQLASHYGVLMVPEFVRQYAEAKGAALEFRDHGAIARGQMALEDEVLTRATAAGDRLVLLDTDLVSTVVYCHHYFGRCPTFLEEAAQARRADLYLVLDIDVPWVADGLRDRGDRRDEVHTLFVETLGRLGAPITLLQGSWDDRLSAAIHHVDTLLNRI